MPTASIKYVEDKNGAVFFPVAHENGVVDDNGTPLATKLNGKQDSLVSGTNIKTINDTSLLGSGNISITNGEDGASAYEIWLAEGNTGTEADFLASLQGDSGYSGAAGELEVVNNLVDGGATSALSAEMGKLLNNNVSEIGTVTTNIDDADLEIRDDNRNILVRFKDGHIQTKYFNSAGGGSGASGELKVLFLGNSLTQDAVAYLPLLLKEICPELAFHIYIFYNGGVNLTTQYSSYLLQPDATCGIFSEFKSSDNAWTNYSNSKSMNWVISNCDFDMLVLQEYGNNGQSDSQVIEAFSNCSDWFFTNYQKPIKVCNMMDAPARSDVSGVTTRIENYAKLAYGSCYSQGIIPAGRAMSYACEDSSLNQLGDEGYLSPDGVHAQEGLPCLLQSYVVAMWLFDHFGINKSIWGSQTRITTDVYTALNVPGENLGTGVVTGTDAQHLAAQKCAIKALKRGRALEIETLNV